MASQDLDELLDRIVAQYADRVASGRAGALAFGAFARGGVAFGGMSLGLVSLGGLAVGHYAIGGKALGDHVISSERQDVAAALFFDAVFRKPLQLFAPQLVSLIDRVLGR
jgi:hypothetical protein